ncbi:MAG: TauD/TfdA family dioxygenase [Myxococcales bacterium]|nr:TauD/TfdA family dioxygenase [Myxococcales bacterium]MCB9522553.1 TauD/TfdA family dioxygenase [Myxococcales bacterium]
MSVLTSAEIQPHNGRLRLTWADGRVDELSPLWLLDNDPAFRHPRTNQRLRELRSLPTAPRLSSVALVDRGLALRWADDLPDTVYPVAWLDEHTPQTPRNGHRPWGAELQARLPAVAFDVLAFDHGQRQVLDDLHRLGWARVRGVPLESGQVLALARRFGFVRATNYGELFDVISKPEAEHLAYTGVELAVHTDNPYRDKVPGVQILHCLNCSRDGGGETVLVDGFAAVQALQARDPEAVRTLAELAVPFRYRDRDNDLRWTRPLVELGRDGRPVAVAFNDRSMAPLPFGAQDTERFYAAYRAFADIVHAPESEVRFLLEPGDAIIFDNQRVLHGRGAYDGRTGLRHLQGCYADRDAFDSRRRMLTGITTQGPAPYMPV